MPTYTITNGGDDGAVWATSPTAWSINATQTSVLLGRTSGNWPSNGWFRFTGITIPRYSTITEAYLRLYNNTSPLVGTPAITVRADDSPAPAAPTSAQDFLNKVRTAAGAAGPSSTAPGYQDIPINQVIQELVNKYDYIGGVIQILVDDAGTAASNIFSVRTLEAGSAYTAQLVIEFTSGVPEAPVAAFSADKTSGNVPLTVQFTDESTGQIDTRSWEFGDGQSSTEQNPAHTFSDVGTFTVTLTVTGPGGQDFFQMYINALPVSVPNSVFSASPISGPIPLTVQFIDESTGSVTSWAWDFGDGGTSTLQNPAHTFLTEGTFTVTLTVTGPGGSSPSILEIDALPAAALIISPLEIYPGYDTVGVRSAFSGDALHTAIMEYKESSGAIWRQGLEMYCDRRPIIREMLSAAGWTDEVNRWQNQNRSVVFFLVSNSAYDVRVSYYAGELIEEFIALTTGEVVGSIWTYDGHSFASYLEAVTYIKTYGVLIGEVQGSAVTLNDDPLVTGTSYFVDSTMGNDTTGDGSAALPWATIPRALQAVHPGDEIRLRGTFNPLSIPISGNYENYIHLVSDDPDSPALITGTSSGSIPAVVSCTGGYIKFGNVDLINTGTSGSQPCLSISGRGVIVDGGYIRPGTNAEYNTAGVSVRPESNDILIQHATIETLVGQGTNGPFGVQMLGGGGHTFRYNSFIGSFQDSIGGGHNYQVEGSGMYHDIHVHNNLISRAYDDGIECEGGDINCSFWGNTVLDAGNYACAFGPCLVGPLFVFRNTLRSLGQGCYKIGAYSGGRVYIYHNTAVGPITGAIIDNAAGSPGDTNSLMAGNMVWKNNVFSASVSRYVINNSFAASFDGNPMWFSHNLMYTPSALAIRWIRIAQTWDAWRAAYLQEPGGRLGNPLFINEAGSDYRLQESPASPGIDAGEVIPGMNDADSPWPFQGLAPDMGAYESGITAAPVAVFTAEPTVGVAPLTVHFVNQSYGIITNILWDFDDGTNSAENTVDHTFTAERVYNVKLTVTGPGGTNIASMNINVGSLPPTTHTLSVSVSGQGEVTLTPPGGVYETGAAVNLLAVPADGWQFAGWSGYITGTDSSTNINMPDMDISVMASFTRIQHVMTIAEPIGQGSTDPLPGQYDVNEGENFSVSAIPVSGWMFSGWQEGGVIISTNQQEVFQLYADRTILAVFEEIIVPPHQYAVTVSVIGQGTTLPEAGSYSIEEGTELSVQVNMVSEGWQFDHWEGDVSGTETIVSLVVNSNLRIIAVFTEIPPEQKFTIAPMVVGGIIVTGIIIATRR